MEVLEAAEKHIPGIIELWMEFTYFNSQIEPYDIEEEDIITQVENHLKERINSEDSLLLVAVDDEGVVGYSISTVNELPPLYKDRSPGYIYDMAITSKYQGQGIGREMLEKIKDWFKSKGVDRIELSAITKKTTNNVFWEKLGFKDNEKVMYLNT